ncbi:fasciclin domain-containing protein [Nocardioides marinquilinus]
MKLTIARRGTAAAAVLALSVSLAACGSEDDNGDDTNAGGSETSSDTGGDMTDTPSEDTGGMTDTPSEDASEDMGGDMTTFGPACGDLPAEGEPGSLSAMTDQPVATAASTNPLLKTLVAAVGAVPGLAGTLDDESAEYTVFAPADTAFEKIPQKDLQGLLDTAAEQDSPLATVLQHHVLGTRVDADAIVGEQTPLAGDALTVSGDPMTDPDNVTVSDGVAEAKILCGGIQTGNATVYVIDTVLTGPLAAG